MDIDEEREQLQSDVRAAGRGPFTGWWAELLKWSPSTLRNVHEYALLAESDGKLGERMRHLVWLVADTVVTHLYPRGAGVHARLAIEHGATVRQIIEALEIAAYVGGRSYRIGLPIIIETVQQAGQSIQSAAPDPDVRKEVEARIGYWDDWMSQAASISPSSLRALVNIAPRRSASEGQGLSNYERELLFFAANACPAILDQDGMRRHARLALSNGATADDLLQALRLVNCIALHSLAEGIVAAADHLNTETSACASASEQLEDDS